MDETDYTTNTVPNFRALTDWGRQRTVFGAVTTKPEVTQNIVKRNVFIAVQEGETTAVMLARKVRTHQSKQLPGRICGGAGGRGAFDRTVA